VESVSTLRAHERMRREIEYKINFMIRSITKTVSAFFKDQKCF
jgi:hypothetical protein